MNTYLFDPPLMRLATLSPAGPTCSAGQRGTRLHSGAGAGGATPTRWHAHPLTAVALPPGHTLCPLQPHGTKAVAAALRALGTKACAAASSALAPPLAAPTRPCPPTSGGRPMASGAPPPAVLSASLGRLRSGPTRGGGAAARTSPLGAAALNALPFPPSALIGGGGGRASGSRERTCV